MNSGGSVNMSTENNINVDHRWHQSHHWPIDYYVFVTYHKSHITYDKYMIYIYIVCRTYRLHFKHEEEEILCCQ